MDAYGPTSTKTYSSCGHFLDDLLKVVSATPPYLRPVDGHRYASLIQQFSQFPLPSHASTPGPNETVSGLPEQQLEAALWRWVSSMLHEDIHPLMSTFTLDAAHFIEAHARGRTFGRFSAEWRLSPMIRAPSIKLRGQLWSKRAMEERMQKADTSELQRRHHFELVVPARWISAWLDEGEQQWLPVPTWTP